MVQRLANQANHRFKVISDSLNFSLIKMQMTVSFASFLPPNKFNSNSNYCDNIIESKIHAFENASIFSEK